LSALAGFKQRKKTFLVEKGLRHVSDIYSKFLDMSTPLITFIYFLFFVIHIFYTFDSDHAVKFKFNNAGSLTVNVSASTGTGRSEYVNAGLYLNQ
jgi:hypothetical protein